MPAYVNTHGQVGMRFRWGASVYIALLCGYVHLSHDLCLFLEIKKFHQIKGVCDSWSPGLAVINNSHSLHFPSLACMSVSLSFHSTLSEHLCAVINVTCISKHNVFPANTLLVDKLGYSAHSDSQLGSLTNRAVNWSRSLVLGDGQSCSSQNTE